LPIRVVVGDLTGMLSDIVIETLETAPDIAVAVAAGEMSAVALAEETGADVAILGGDSEGLPAAGRELFWRRPWMNVLTLRGDGSEAFLYQVRPSERPLGEISPQTLLEAVRAAGPALW
jgi:hypothetical protein